MKLWRSVVRRLDIWGSSGIAEEVEAFLQGGLLERMRDPGAGGPAPAWMWLNAVAHGDKDLVESVSMTLTAQSSSGWAIARAQLADELLDRSGRNPETMRAIQEQVLVPLEQRIASLEDLTPARLVDIGLRELGLAQA